jgi:hypothetical protein
VKRGFWRVWFGLWDDRRIVVESVKEAVALAWM